MRPSVLLAVALAGHGRLAWSVGDLSDEDMLQPESAGQVIHDVPMIVAAMPTTLFDRSSGVAAP